MTRPTRPAAEETLDRLLSIPELANYLCVPIATIYRWRYSGGGPIGYRIGRHIRYRVADVERWLEAQRDTRPGG